MQSLKKFALHNFIFINFIIIAVACESAVLRDFNTHMAGNDHRSALQLLESELSSSPNSAEVNYLMGKLLSSEKKYIEADIYFERTMRLSSMYREQINDLKERNYRLELNEGFAEWDQDRFASAIQFLTYAVHIFPDRAEVYPVLAAAFKETGQYEELRRVSIQCLQLQPENTYCGLNLAESYILSGNFKNAIEISQNVLESNPTNQTLNKILAYAHLESGNSYEAQKTFLIKIQNHFDYESVKQFANELNNLGEIYLAEEFYRVCLEREPRDQDILNALSYIYLETGNYRLMVQANERLLTLNPDNRLIQKNLMLAYELYGDIDNYRAIRSKLGLD